MGGKDQKTNMSKKNIMFFIPRNQVLDGAKVTYANLICGKRPLKVKRRCVRMTVGGKKLKYKGDPGSPVIFLLNTSIFLNSIGSDAYTCTKLCTANVKRHYL